MRVVSVEELLVFAYSGVSAPVCHGGVCVCSYVYWSLLTHLFMFVLLPAAIFFVSPISWPAVLHAYLLSNSKK